MRLCPEGWPFILGSLFVALVLLSAARVWSMPALSLVSGLAFLAAGFCVWFFRDPPRRLPQGDGLILSPAYGKVMEIVPAQDAWGQPVSVIRIFLSVFDAHLQVAPVDGQVMRIRYQRGRFLDARDPKAAFENEQNHMEFMSAKGSLVVTQIAGLIARRIVCHVREGQAVKAGDKIGLIRFGSQVDVTVPAQVNWRVKPGDRVEGGQVLAEFAR